MIVKHARAISVLHWLMMVADGYCNFHKDPFIMIAVQSNVSKESIEQHAGGPGFVNVQ